MKNNIDSNFAIAILALVAACVGFSFWFYSASIDADLGDAQVSQLTQGSGSESPISYNEIADVSQTAPEFKLVETTGWITHTDEEYGLSIKYPPNLNIRVDRPVDSYEILKFIPDNENFKKIFIINYHKDGKTLETAREEMLSEGNYHFVEPFPYLENALLASTDGMLGKNYVLKIFTEKGIYTIYGSAQTAERQNEINTIFSTFTFL